MATGRPPGASWNASAGCWACETESRCRAAERGVLPLHVAKLVQPEPRVLRGLRVPGIAQGFLERGAGLLELPGSGVVPQPLPRDARVSEVQRHPEIAVRPHVRFGLSVVVIARGRRFQRETEGTLERAER